MSEKKFRVWDGECYISLSTAFEKSLIGIQHDFVSDEKIITSNIIETYFDDMVIEQFIDNQDKNGKDIYDGDKLKNNIYTFVVYWDKKSSSFKLKNNDGWIYSVNSFIDTLEIIGNIHEATP